MKIQSAFRKSFFAFVFAALALIGASPALAQTVFAWTGTNSIAWSDPANWGGAGVPANGDSVVFPPGAVNFLSVNDVGTISLGALVVQDPNYVIAGSPVVITGAVDTGLTRIVLPIDFQANNVQVNNSWLAGGVSGSGQIALSGLLNIEGTNGFSGFITTPSSAVVNLIGGATLPAVVLGNVGVAGDGTVGPVFTTLVAPTGNGLVTGDLTINTGSANYTIAGATVGAGGYAPIAALGAVTLSDATLNINAAGYLPAVGDTIVLVSNDASDPVTGTFNGLPEGSPVVINGAVFVLSYVGGDGNDITLVAVTAPKAWTGATDNLWSTASNWAPAGAPVPGNTDLVFPAGQANTGMTNDLPAGATFATLTFQDPSYTLGGNGIIVTSSISGQSNVIAAPVDFQGNNVAVSNIALGGGVSGSGLITLTGTLLVAGNNTFSGAVVSSGGTLVLFNNATLPAAILGNTAIAGYGSVASAAISGAVTPQVFIASAGDVTLDGPVNYTISGTNVFTDYSLLIDGGNLTLGSNSTLNVALGGGFTPSTGQQFVLILNNGANPVGGTFNGLPEGATLNVGGFPFTISYVGGDGNDVVLTASALPPATVGVVSTPNPSVVGQQVTITATVTGVGTPTGTVSFFADADPIGSAPLSGGTASITSTPSTAATFTITAIYSGDAFNGASIGSTSQTVNADTTAPVVTFTSTPSSVSNVASPTFSFTATDDVGVTAIACVVDGGSPFPCASPVPIGPLADGPHTLTVFAGDAVNNVGFASYSWTIDTVAPAVALDGPFNLNDSNVASFGITGTCSDTSTTVQVTIADLAYNQALSCSTGTFNTGLLDFSGLANGTHSVTASQTDGAGNTATASSTIEIHTGAPTLTVDTPGVINSGNDGSYTVSGDCGSSAEGRTVSVQIGSVTTSGTCISGRYTTTATDVTSLGQGAVTITASVTDTFGNSATATASTTKDTIGPAVTMDALDVINNANKAAYSFTGTCEASGLNVSFSLTSGGTVNGSVACSGGTYSVGPIDVSSLNDGLVAVQVGQFDVNGNGTTTNGSVNKDTVNPTLAFDAPAVITTSNQSSYTVTGTCSEAGRTVTVNLGSITGTTTCTAGGFSFTTDASGQPEGSIGLTASMTDAAGNSATASATATKNTTPPNAVVVPSTIVDFNGDGKGDLAWVNAGQYAGWLMNGVNGTGFGGLTGGTNSVMRALVDFNGDGRTDILWRLPDGSYRITLMNGLTQGAATQIMAAGTGWEVIAAGDFNGDGRADLLWQHPTLGYGVWLMNGTAISGAGTLASPGPGFNVQIVADFNHDGRMDLIWHHADGRTLITTMNGITGNTNQLLGAGAWTPKFATDLNGDGTPDLIWQNADGTTAAWLMSNGGATAFAQLLGAGTGWSVVGVGDLNGDGRGDLIWSHTDGSTGSWLMNGFNTIGFGNFFGASGSGWHVTKTRELDGDGRIDVLLTHDDGRVAAWTMNGTNIKAASVLVNAGSGWVLAP